MQPLRLAVATVNQTPLDWHGNEARIRNAIKEARRAESQVLCLPELAITGYGCEDAFHGVAHSERALRHLEDIAEDTRDILVIVGVPLRHQTGLFNTAAFLLNGQILGFVAKQHLAGDGVHYEPRWFRAWTPHRIASARAQGREVPMGDLVFDVGGLRIGAEICEDAWVPNRPATGLARAGCDIIVNPTASHFSFDKHRVRENIVTESSRAFGCAYLFSNALGNESGRMIFDGQCLIGAGGDVVARTRRFNFDEITLATAVVDIDLLRMRRNRVASLRPDDEGAHIIPVEHRFTETGEAPSSAIPTTETWDTGTNTREEEFTRAVSLALFDYLRKSRSHGFVVSLSGGADSTATAILAALAFNIPFRELGIEELRGRIPWIEFDEASFSGGWLDTVYQASANSGEVTRNAAQAVANGLDTRHSEWTIEEMVRGYRALVETTLQRPLTWEHDDIALQNIQARARSPGIWMLANIRNSLLLSTSNRSEAAVGYATMDGDTSGSIAPIAGIDKNYLRKWLRWMMENGPEGFAPMAFLEPVCVQAPTAELRPQEQGQTDETDLMPYDLLDAIERLAIRDHMEPPEILRALKPEWAERVGGEKQLRTYLKRFFTLWSRNQWKRERYAPSFHLDDENLDPKTWCRFPILSGGFKEELGEIE